jgi:hypothetical protein
MALAVSSSVSTYRYGDPVIAIPLLSASGATGTVHWSTSSGTLSNATGATSSLSPIDRSEIVIVTAVDDSATVTKGVQIYATVPYQPKWGVEADFDDETEISVSEDNVPKFRVVSELTARFPLVYEKRSFDEYWIMMQFFNWHRKSTPFYIDDIASGILAFGYFDSAIRIAAQGADWVDYSHQFKSYAFQIPNDPTTGPTRPLTGLASILLEGGGHVLLE